MLFPSGRFGDQFDYAAFYASEHYREWVAPQGQIDGIQATLEKTASGIAILSGIRHERAGYAGEREFRRMRLIAPHFRRAVLIGKIIEMQQVQVAAFAETISGLAAGVFLVNAHGDLVHANPSGEAMLAAADPVQLSHGTLIAIDRRASSTLAGAIAAAGSGDAAAAPAATAMALAGRHGDHFTAHVLPLAAGARREAGAHFAAVAALFVRKASFDLAAAIDAATQLYGFTPAEVRVLRAVIEVGGVAPVAALLDLSRSTVQTHLEHLFTKTGTRRQADLVKLIAGYHSPARPPRQK